MNEDSPLPTFLAPIKTSTTCCSVGSDAQTLSLLFWASLSDHTAEGLTITCTIWGTHDEVKLKLPEVWVQVGGIPPQLQNNFLILWAVGTLLWATQMVDITSRETAFDPTSKFGFSPGIFRA